MSNAKKNLVVLFILVFFVGSVSAFEVTNVALHLHLAGLSQAEEPTVFENHLILSVKGPYRYVGAAFSYEDWKEIHSFKKNDNGVFVLAIPIPYGEKREVFYRLVIDGLWAADPSNPYSQRDYSTGAELSLVNLPEKSHYVLGDWEPAVQGGAHFYFEAEPNQVITVIGNFNAWDPFIHEMEETSPGHYELNLSLPPGTYYYSFFYKGQRVFDPLNKDLLYSKDGKAVSLLAVKD